MLFAREVDNGGYRQFFWNSSGMYYRHVLDGLKALDATNQHEALSRFVGFFPPDKNLVQRRERQLGLEGISEEQMNEIKSYERFVYRAGGFERTLTPLWVRYIERHPEDFFK